MKGGAWSEKGVRPVPQLPSEVGPASEEERNLVGGEGSEKRAKGKSLQRKATVPENQQD